MKENEFFKYFSKHKNEHVCFPRRSGLSLFQKHQIEVMKVLKMDFAIATPKGLEVYTNGELVETRSYKK